MAEMVTLTLSRNDAGQILDGLRVRLDSWRNTAQFFETGHNPDDLMIEECSDSAEAEQIAGHYAEIIASLETQLANTNQRTTVTPAGDKTTECGSRDENIAAISAELHSHKRWEQFYKANCDALSGFPGFWRYAIEAADQFTAAETAFEREHKNTDKTFEYPEAIFEFVQTIMDAKELPDAAALRKLADKTIAEVAF